MIGQPIFRRTTQGIDRFDLPDPDSEVIPRLRWGSAFEPCTPAYWRARVFFEEPKLPAGLGRGCIGETLFEEAAACLLAGYGITSEIGWAAFNECKRAGLFADTSVTSNDFLGVISSPLLVDGRTIRYRFANQKSHYLGELVKRWSDPPSTMSCLDLRRWLMRFSGIGPKTASFIVRNFRRSDEVAILDRHIQRACLTMGLFSQKASRMPDYFEMERRFLVLSEGMGVRPSHLDLVIWAEMRGSLILSVDANLS